MFSMDLVSLDTFGALTDGEEQPETTGSGCQRAVDVDRICKDWTVGTLVVSRCGQIGTK